MKVLLLAFLIFFIPTALFSLPEHNYRETRIHSQKIEDRFGDWHKRAQEHSKVLEISDHHKIRRWRDQMAGINLTNELAGVRHLNALINSDIEYVDDFTHFHKKDFWDDPETTLEEGGDCEDIALLKAASLHLLNWPENRMHLLVGYLMERGKKESHAVLLIETQNGDQHILRSITDQVVLPDQFNFLPIYAVDTEGTVIVKAPEHI